MQWLSPLSRQVLLVTVNGNPADYHTIHPTLPLENGPAKADMYSTPQYKWEPSDDMSGSELPGNYPEFHICSYSVSPFTASSIYFHFGKLFGLLKLNNCCHLAMMADHTVIL